MASVNTYIDTSPERVFAVLADGWTYTNWVVGASHMRAVDADWPAVGSKLYHATGIWPVLTRDETKVDALDRGRRIALVARGRPLGEARVVLDVAAERDGTRITMQETPIAGPGKWLHSSLLEAALAKRNRESLARLASLVERRTSPE